MLNSPARRRRAQALIREGWKIAAGRGRGRLYFCQFWAFFAALAWFAYAAPKQDFEALAAPILFFSLGILALYDVRYFIIPDIPLILLGIVGLALLIGRTPADAAARLGAAVGVFAFFWACGKLYLYWRGREGFGFGDVKLLSVGALWIEPKNLSIWILLACASAALTVLIDRLSSRSEQSAQSEIPFGPHLALVLWLIWLYG